MARFQISITYLSDSYHGQEWPPSPMRLFQAMIAGHNQGRARAEQDAGFQTAMRWLERLPSPEILACDVSDGSVCRRYVPNNDDDIAMRRWARGTPESPNDKAKRYTEKISRPRLLDGDRSVHYTWEVDENEVSYAHEVAGYASQITVLGWGIDMVLAKGKLLSVDQTVPGMVFKPHSDQRKGHVLRVPCAGSYDSAEKRYLAFLQSGMRYGGLTFTKPPLEYQQVGYVREGELQEVHYACFNLFGLDGSTPYRRDPQHAVAVAAMLRHSVHEVLVQEGYEDYKVREILGHGPKGKQIGCLPLPSVGHPQADGLIRRVLLIAPEQDILHRLVWALDGRELKADGQPVAMLSSIQGWDGVVDQFTRSSDVWETVTPVVLPGFDQLGERKKKTDKLIIRSLIQSGFKLSDIRDIWHQIAPWHRYGRRAGTYKVANYMRYPQYHVRVRLCRPIQGPVALGSGRYFGLGLMAVA